MCYSVLFYWSNKYLNHKFIELSRYDCAFCYCLSKWIIFLFRLFRQTFCWFSSFILDICSLISNKKIIIKSNREGYAQNVASVLALMFILLELCIIFVDFQQTANLNLFVVVISWMFHVFSFSFLFKLSWFKDEHTESRLNARRIKLLFFFCCLKQNVYNVRLYGILNTF